MVEFAALISLFLLSSVKFLFAPSTILYAGYSPLETIVISVSGAWFGLIVFYYLGDVIIKRIAIIQRRQKAHEHAKPKRNFTWRNKFIVKFKTRFGILGLASILGFASIPLTAFLAVKYFKDQRFTLPYLMLSSLIWGVALTLFDGGIRSLVAYIQSL